MQLPQQPAGGIPLPPQSHDPSTLADVFSASRFQNAVEANHDLAKDDEARAEVYKTEVVMEDPPAAEPAWFIDAITPMKILLAQTRNFQLNDGQFSPFIIVPFIDGTMPDGAPNHLPPLVSLTEIRNLSPADATAYVAGYRLENPGGAAAKRKAIARFIGCTVWP